MLEPIVAHLSDRECSDELLRHLVASVYASLSAMYVSIAMGIITAVVAWALSRESVFLVFAVLHVAIGAYRVFITWRRRATLLASDSRREILAADHRYFIASSLFALLVGMFDYALLRLPADLGAGPLAMAMTAAYCIAFVTRSSGRLRLLIAQEIAMAGPMFYGCLTLPVVNGPLYAFLIVCLVVAAILMAVIAHAGVVELFHANETTRRMARTDALTGLLNRYSFAEALEAELRDAAGRADARFAILMVDIDRFKEINDSLGHNAGDAVIVEGGRRLRATVDDSAVVARLGGDEFVVLARRDAEVDGAILAHRIVANLASPYFWEATSLPSTASVGVALFPDHGRTAEELMKNADIALYEAKRGGRNMARMFDVSMSERIMVTRAFELEMQAAIASDAFEPWFQPIQNLTTGRPQGYEALARWRHATQGWIPPGSFIPVAEQNGAILTIGARILEKACVAAAGWSEPLTVAVNLSPVQFRDPDGLVRTVRTTLERTGLAPFRLELEVTESLLIGDSAAARAAIVELAALGVKFSLDDFGAGYSSLSYIRNYPFSKIKIDKHFIDSIGADPTADGIIAAVCVLARRLGLEIIAEGVETPDQDAALRAFGITRAQGYLYGRPAPFAVQPERQAAVPA